MFCRNDIGRELIDKNNMIYLHIYIVTRNVYSTTRELTFWAKIDRQSLWGQVITRITWRPNYGGNN
jgi:hypothetical protein